jgi:hypothetical protein
VSIYGLYSGNDGQSHLAELQIAGQGPPLQSLLPCTGWRPFQCEPGHRQDRHPTPLAGMTFMLGGCMTIGVGGGSLREVALRSGDMLLVLDTQGAGHSTDIIGPDWLRTAGVSFALRDWPAVRDAFLGWPDNLLPP